MNFFGIIFSLTILFHYYFAIGNSILQCSCIRSLCGLITTPKSSTVTSFDRAVTLDDFLRIT